MRRNGFVLLEVILGVAIFAIGVIALGACIHNGVNAEVVRAEDARARLALANRMAEIETGAIKVQAPRTEELKGMFTGMTLKQWFKPWSYTDGQKRVLEGIDEIFLEVSWRSAGELQTKAVSFYVPREP